MIHVVNRVKDMIARDNIIECWDNLQTKIGHEIALLENNYDKNVINKLYQKAELISFVVKTRPDHTSDELHQSIKRSSDIDVVIKEFKLA
jgi:hypothetical protein